MRRRTSLLLRGTALCCLLAVAACDSPEQRAQGHFERGMSLLEEGEADRAMLEFRSALQADAQHEPAIRAYAALLTETGDPQAALPHYLRLTDLDPEDADAHLAAARIFLTLGDYGAVEHHVDIAMDIEPEDRAIRSMAATVAFRRGEVEEALALARGVLERAPDDLPARMVIVADHTQRQDHRAALEAIDEGLTHWPDSMDLHLAKLGIFERIGDQPALGGQLGRMVELFPDDPALLGALMRWHISQGEPGDAVAIMRRVADRTPEETDGHLQVAQLILEVEGPEAARAELERQAEGHPRPLPFRVALAQLAFAEGREEEAISDLEVLLAGEGLEAGALDMHLTLARMLEQAGRSDAARERVADILAADDTNVGALKMRAAWRIEADDTENALTDLRRAALTAPRDPEIMTLMAFAHEREGAADLVGERLARAVEASQYGTEESLRYVRHLIRDARYGQAETVVLDALQRSPEDTSLLLALGQVHIQRKDHARAAQVVGILRGLGGKRARDAAAGLEIALLQAQGRLDDAITLLESLAAEEGGDIRAHAGLVQARVATGDTEGARQAVETLLAEDPGSVSGRMLKAGIEAVEGNVEAAEALYRGVVADRPDFVGAYQILVSLLNGAGRADEARALLATGLERTGRASDLLSMAASMSYAAGDHEAAIAHFEELYARNTSDVVVANNLASLLSAHRADEESLERAFQVARRLRGTTVPHFQDTYGWILVRRGDARQALAYLEPAAAALDHDPVVLYHLGMAQFELEEWDAARATLERALAAGAGRTDLPQLERARERLGEIDRRAAEAPADG